MKSAYYNITYNVDETIVEEWLRWMKSDYLPQIIATESFTSIKILKILVEEEMGGESYAVMYKSTSLESLEQFLEINSNELNKIMSDKFGQKVVSFLTLLEEEYTI